MDALLRRVGVARVASLPILLETLKLLHTVGPLPGRDLVTLSCSGGEAALIADAGAGRRVRFRPFTAEQGEAVRATLSDLVTISNPLDYHIFIWGQAERLRATFTAVMACGWDLACLVLDFPRTDSCSDADWQVSLAAWEQARDATQGRAAVLATLPDCLPEGVAEALIAAGIVPLLGIDDALAAAEAAADIGAAQAGPLPAALLAAPAPAGAAVTLDEWQGKRLLAAFGLPHPGGRLVASAAEAVAAAPALGYPLVVKAVGSELAHKSELGAVALDLRDAGCGRGRGAPHGAARRGDPGRADDHGRCRRADPWGGARSAGRLVPGPGLRRGAGRAARRSRAPAAADDRPRRSGRRCWGSRWRPCCRGSGAGRSVTSMPWSPRRWRWRRSPLAHAGRLVELDVNPLIVRPAGKGAVAADVLIRLAEDGAVS